MREAVLVTQYCGVTPDRSRPYEFENPLNIFEYSDMTYVPALLKGGDSWVQSHLWSIKRINTLV